MSLPRPPRRTVGTLDESRRDAILRKAETLPIDRKRRLGLTEERIVGAWTEAEFFGDLSSALVETAERYGLPREALLAQFDAKARSLAASGLHAEDPLHFDPNYLDPDYQLKRVKLDRAWWLTLIVIPDTEFLTAIEHTVEKYASWASPARDSCRELVRYVDKALRVHGVPYEATPDLRAFRWSGDRAHAELTMDPALQALEDSRLLIAREEFSDALSKRRLGRSSDMRDAVHEAASATESVMAALLASHDVDPPRQRAAAALFGRLAEHRVVPGHIQYLALAAAQIRNEEGGHGQGTTARIPSPDMADAALGVAASAIVLLASFLP